MKAPGFGDRRKAMMEDIAVLTGGTFISEDRGIKLENVTLDMLGSADQVSVDKENTTIIVEPDDGAREGDQGPRADDPHADGPDRERVRQGEVHRAAGEAGRRRGDHQGRRGDRGRDEADQGPRRGRPARDPRRGGRGDRRRRRHGAPALRAGRRGAGREAQGRRADGRGDRRPGAARSRSAPSPRTAARTARSSPTRSPLAARRTRTSATTPTPTITSTCSRPGSSILCASPAVR